MSKYNPYKRYDIEFHFADAGKTVFLEYNEGSQVEIMETKVMAGRIFPCSTDTNELLINPALITFVRVTENKKRRR